MCVNLDAPFISFCKSSFVFCVSRIARDQQGHQKKNRRFQSGISRLGEHLTTATTDTTDTTPATDTTGTTLL